MKKNIKKINNLEKVLYGKTYAKEKLYFNKNKILRRQWFSLLFCNLILLVSIIVLMLHTYYQPATDGVVVDYDGLTIKEKQHVQDIMADVKKEYLEYQKSIIFTDDLIKHMNFVQKTELYLDRVDGSDVLGFNGNGHIVVLYTNDTLALKRTICHELLHTFFKTSDGAHKIIYDEEYLIPCFKESDYFAAALNLYYYKNNNEGQEDGS